MRSRRIKWAEQRGRYSFFCLHELLRFFFKERPRGRPVLLPETQFPPSKMRAFASALPRTLTRATRALHLPPGPEAFWVESMYPECIHVSFVTPVGALQSLVSLTRTPNRATMQDYGSVVAEFPYGVTMQGLEELSEPRSLEGPTTPPPSAAQVQWRAGCTQVPGAMRDSPGSAYEDLSSSARPRTETPK